MTNKEAIEQLKWVKKRICDITYSPESVEALELAIKALERDAKVDDITEHWNDNSSSFVSACNAFEDILDVYDRYLT